MASAEGYEACCRLADDLEQHWSEDEDLNRTHAAIISSLKSASDHPKDGAQQIIALTPTLARHVEVILQKGRPDGFQSAILGTLADATREAQIWRPVFGLSQRPDRAMNLKQMDRETPPDSILEVARRIVAGTIRATSSRQMRPALRIIANCCADNNVNRSSFIGRDGIEALLELLRLRKDCDLVIPVLYNVCVDFDEPATDVHGKPWDPLPQMQAASGESETSSATTLSMAEQRLGTYWFPYENKTSFQILLDAREQAEDCAGTLADLVEMASRVALYGTQNFVQEHDGNEPGDIIEVDTTADIVHLLLSHGADLADEDIECRVSTCQAVLNLLSQQDTHTTVISSDNAVRKLIHLPYSPTHLQRPLEPDEDDEEEETPLAPYRKEILKLIYTISATEAYTETFDVSSNLTKSCILDLGRFLDHQPTSTTPPASGPFASICVLLANCINTTDRAKNLLRDVPDIAIILQTLLIKISDPEILLPAVDLAARLALYREGQDAFCKSQGSIFLAIAQILHNRASEVDATGLEVQRNAIALARLLVKGQSEDVFPKFSIDPAQASHETGLSTITSLSSEVYSLWDRTTDVQTKIEIGRLFIEMLRTIHGAKRDPTGRNATSPHENKTEHVPTQPPASSLTDEFNRLDISSSIPSAGIFKDKVAEMICYTLTQPQGPSQPQSQPHTLASAPAPVQQHANNTNTQARAQAQTHAEAEAWFGLALLSTIPHARASIRATLARDDFHILNRLRQIVASDASPLPLMKEDEDNTKPATPADVGSQRQVQPRMRQTTTRDPRYENIKVLVVKMLQTEQPLPAPGPPRRLDKEEELVQEGLEAAAAEMGLDWVVV